MASVVVFEIPSGVVGKLVGRAGSTIKGIQTKSQCVVAVEVGRRNDF